MARRTSATLVALMSVVTLILGACGGSATASPISDPKEILTQSVEAAQAAKTVHLKIQLAGKLPIGDLSGLLGAFPGLPGASAAPAPTASSAAAGLDLTGTTADGDVDMAGSAAHFSFVAPLLMNLEGDVIAVDGAVYVKVSLLGDKYRKMDGTSGSGASPAPSPSPTAGVLDTFRAELDKLATPPEKLADEHCGDTDCYHVRVKLANADTAPLASLAPGVSGAGTLDAYVRKNDLRPAQLVLTVDSGTAAGLTVTVDLSAWDAPVTITAPPADQVDTSGGLFPSFAIPSFAFPSPSP